jgi:hypothetical protein
LTITYRVADSVTDERGNRIRAVQVDAHDMVWDAVSQKIYVSEPAFLGLNADTVRALDPVTGALGPPATLGNHPTALDVSDDGQFLYVGLQNANSIERLNLPNLTRDALIAIPGRSSANNPFLATEIKVAPGEPKTIAIRRADDPFDYFFLDDVAILRDAVQLPNIHSAFPPVPFQNRYVESIAWGADATTLFGAAVTTVWPVIQHLAVDTNGVVLSERSPELPATYGLRSLTHYSSGRVYTDNGFVYDAQSRVIVGGLRDASGPITTRALAVDPAGQVLFGLSSNSTTFHPTYALRKFDVNTRLEIDSIALPFDRHFPRGNRLLRWGHNGLAYHIGRERNSSDKGYILLIDGPFVNP